MQGHTYSKFYLLYVELLSVGVVNIENLVVEPRASCERNITLEKAKSKRLFYTKNTLARVVVTRAVNKGNTKLMLV